MKKTFLAKSVAAALSVYSSYGYATLYDAGSYGTLTLTNSSDDTVLVSTVDTLNVTSSSGLGHEVASSEVTTTNISDGLLNIFSSPMGIINISGDAVVHVRDESSANLVNISDYGYLTIQNNSNVDTVLSNAPTLQTSTVVDRSRVGMYENTGRASLYIEGDGRVDTIHMNDGGALYFNYGYDGTGPSAGNVIFDSSTGLFTLRNDAEITQLEVIHNNINQHFNRIERTVHIDNLVVSKDANMFFGTESDSSIAAPYTSTLGGTADSVAITFQPKQGVTQQNFGIYDTANSGIMSTYKNANNQDVYFLNDRFLASATSSSQTLYRIVGDGEYKSYHLSDFDDGYLDANTSTGLTYNFIGRNQQLMNVAARATLVDVAGDNYTLRNVVAHNGVDNGGIKLSGNNNTVQINNGSYNGFIDTSGNDSSVNIQEFGGLSRLVSSGDNNALNIVNMRDDVAKIVFHGDFTFPAEVNPYEGMVSGTVGRWETINLSGRNDIDFATYVTQSDTSVNGNIIGRGDAASNLYWVDRNEVDDQGWESTYTFFEAGELQLSNVVLNLNRTNMTEPDAETYTSADKSVARIDGNVVAVNSVVDMGAGMNTMLDITGNVYGDDIAESNVSFSGNLLIDRIGLDLNTQRGDLVRVGGDISANIVLNVTDVVNEGLPETQIQLIDAPNNTIDANEHVSLWVDPAVGYQNADTSYTLGTSPYAWYLVGRNLDGYYLSNMLNNVPVLTPEINVLLMNPIAATHFMGPTVSKGVRDYIHGGNATISHAQDWWLQYSMDTQDQSLMKNVDYHSRIKGFDIGKDIMTGDKGYWGASVSYRGMSTNIDSAIADVTASNTETQGLLGSLYGVYEDGAHQWDGQVYLGRMWGTTNGVGAEQISDSGISYGGYGQYGYTFENNKGLTWKPYIGVEMHASDWGANEFTNGQSDNVKAYVGLELSGQWGDGYQWSVNPRYTQSLNNVDINVSGVSQSLQATLPESAWGVALGLSRHWKGGSWYLKYDQSRMSNQGSRHTVTVGGTASF